MVFISRGQSARAGFLILRPIRAKANSFVSLCDHVDLSRANRIITARGGQGCWQEASSKKLFDED